jgi:hypothetical protein
LGTGCTSQDPELARDTNAIRQCFSEYKDALLAEDGAKAVELVDGETIELYSRQLDWALKATPGETRALGLLDKLSVLRIRMEFSRQELLEMDGRELFVYGVDHGWIDPEGVKNNSLGKITVTQDSATVQGLNQGKPTPINWVFTREGDAWKLNLLSILPAAETAFKMLIRESGQTEDEFLIEILSMLSEKRPDKSIWFPPD